MVVSAVNTFDMFPSVQKAITTLTVTLVFFICIFWLLNLTSLIPDTTWRSAHPFGDFWVEF